MGASSEDLSSRAHDREAEAKKTSPGWASGVDPVPGVAVSTMPEGGIQGPGPTLLATGSESQQQW